MQGAQDVEQILLLP